MAFTFDGIDLSDYGWTNPGIAGALGLPEQVVAETDTGRLHPDSVDRRRSYGELKLKGYVCADSHAQMLSYWRSIKQAVSPSKGYCWLTRDDVPGRRIKAHCLGAQVTEGRRPFETDVMAVDMRFDLQGPWESTSAVTATLTTSYLTVGDLEAWPVWTITATGSVASPQFTVNGHRFIYDGNLVVTDVVVVDTVTPTVTKNGGTDMAHRTLGAKYPRLQPGMNSIRLYPTGFTLGVSYYPRWE